MSALHVQRVKMSAPPGHDRGTRAQAARSSRRKVGSTGPQVVLGGGAGVYGSSLGQNDAQYSHNVAASPTFPVQFPPPSSATFPSPISPLFPNMYRAPSPLPPQLTESNATTKSPDISRDRDPNTAMGSISSLSTAASTSSRTLKTPHSKLDHLTHVQQPSIVSSSDSHDSTGSNGYECSPLPALPKERAIQRDIAVGSSRSRGSKEREQRSPTPTQRTLSKTPREVNVQSGEGRPSAPEMGSSRTASSTRPSDQTRPSKPRGSTPPHLDLTKTTKPNHRLSQDWVQIDFPAPVMQAPRARGKSQGPNLGSSPENAEAKVRDTRSQSRQGGLPEAVMVPMKGAQPLDTQRERSASISRPPFERASTAPPLSPPAESDQLDSSRPQRKGRGSLDQLRSTSSTEVPANQRTRKNSHSTPPSVMLESTSSAAKFNPFKGNKSPSPAIGSDAPAEGRSSVDPSRSEWSARQAELKGQRQDQPRSLGVSSGRASRDQERSISIDMERKSSGLSMKKSTGALKALFNRGVSGKGKERAEMPPLPPNASEQRDRLRSDLAMPSRPSTSNSNSSPGRSASRAGRPTSPGSPTPPGKTRPGEPRYDSDIIPGRPSFASDRASYPAPLNRAKSHGATEPSSMPMVESRSESSAQPQRRSPVGLSNLQPPVPGRRMPDRDLPPLPPPSPSASAMLQGANTPTSSMEAKSSGSSPLSYATARDFSPKSADPLSAASSGKRQGQLTPDPSPRSRTERSPGPSAQIPPSSSLHLLQLPSLDLDFDLSFDKIGTSPSTPRHRSPGNRRSPHSPHSPSPQRSLTTKISSKRLSPALRRQNSDRILDRSERRRSKSFDGPISGAMFGDIWRDIGQNGAFTSPSMAKLFASSSNSAPVFSVPLEATSSDDSVLSNSTSSSSTVTPQPTNQSRPEEQGGSKATAVPSHVALARRYDSGASTRSGPSSSDHARTPSNTSSTHDTESPSPPRTPSPLHSSVRDYGYTYESSPSEPTPKALSITHDLDTLQQPIVLSLPPSIPLPPAPGQEEAPATPPKATKALTTPKNRIAELPAPATPPKDLKDRSAKKEVIVFLPPTIPAGPLLAGIAPPSTRPVIVTKVEDSPKPEGDDSHLRPVGGPTVITVKAARPWKASVGHGSKEVVPDERSLRALVKGLEDIVHSFCAPASIISAMDRCNLIRTQLLPLLGEIEKRPHSAREESTNRALREVAFDWAESLLYELRVEQAANERGACLEGLSAVMESSCLSETALADDAQHSVRFTNLMIKCMMFVMGKLGAKGVFHNTLLFSGRFLAFAFFRVPHIAEQLITVLQLPRGALMRFTRAALLGPPVSVLPRYPKHLLPLCFDTCSSYTTRLASLSADFKTDEEREAFLFTPGNWLRRWQSDDSELFPAFYRAYHRQLALYLAPAIEHYEILNEPVPLQILLRAPGYAHLATVFAKKCHAYILGSINAVTTSSSTQGFDATESAGLKASQKPAVLETANRRLTETISTLINTHIVLPDSKGSMVECDGQQLWSSILDLWTKSLIGKTSLYAPKGVFSLFDLLDGIVDPPHDPLTGERRLKEASLLDVPHLIHVIRLVLCQAEHALTIVKVVAFVFTHWEALTARSEDRKELCLGLLLEKGLFERLTLFWSQSVRSYVLRLVVFRLSHVHTTKDDGINHDVEIDSVRLLQTRLERIRKRYTELEPKDANTPIDRGDSPYLGSSIDGLLRSRSTITMIADSPRGPSNKAERLLGLGLGSVDKGMSSLEVEDTSRMGKAKGWLKKSFANKKRKGLSPALSSSTSTSPNNSPRLSPSPQMDNTGTFTSPHLALKTPPVGFIKSARPSLDAPHAPRAQSNRSKSTPPILSLDSPELEEYSPPRRLPNSEEDSPGGVAFEFELPTMSPRSDTFDPTPTPSSPRRNSQPPSPRGPTSPHMSRSFSKRSSLLPPNTASILAYELASPGSKHREARVEKGEEGYPKKLHAYAIRMLAELEDAQKEYDEWWAPGGVGTVDGAPPRLTVAWPFHEGDE